MSYSHGILNFMVFVDDKDIHEKFLPKKARFYEIFYTNNATESNKYTAGTNQCQWL